MWYWVKEGVLWEKNWSLICTKGNLGIRAGLRADASERVAQFYVLALRGMLAHNWVHSWAQEIPDSIPPGGGRQKPGIWEGNSHLWRRNLATDDTISYLPEFSYTLLAPLWRREPFLKTRALRFLRNKFPDVFQVLSSPGLQAPQGCQFGQLHAAFTAWAPGPTGWSAMTVCIPRPFFPLHPCLSQHPTVGQENTATLELHSQSLKCPTTLWHIWGCPLHLCNLILPIVFFPSASSCVLFRPKQRKEAHNDRVNAGAWHTEHWDWIPSAARDLGTFFFAQSLSPFVPWRSNFVIDNDNNGN